MSISASSTASTAAAASRTRGGATLSSRSCDRLVAAAVADELTHHAEAARAGHDACVGRQVAGDDAQQGGLAGPVGADEGDLLAVADAEAHLVEQHPPVRQLVTHSGDIHVTHEGGFSLPDGRRHPHYPVARVRCMTPRSAVPEPGDVTTSANHRTVGSYERIARDYADDTAPGPDGTGDFSGEALRRLVAVVPEGGTALEVGSGPGWDADFLEAQGVAVRRTDVTQAFLDLQAARGKAVERLDVTTDDLGGPYDAVLALAVLQHVERAQLPAVLGRVAGALRPGGAFLVSVREGDGDQWEVGDSGNPYFTVHWREPDLCDVLEDAGLVLEWRSAAADSEESSWLTFLARRGR